MGTSQPLGNLLRAAVKMECWPAARLAYYLDLQPGDAVADSGPQRFRGCFLGCKPGCEAFRGFALLEAISLLGCRVDLVKEPGAEAIHRTLDAVDFDHIDAGADDHADYKAKPWAGGTHEIMETASAASRKRGSVT